MNTVKNLRILLKFLILNGLMLCLSSTLKAYHSPDTSARQLFLRSAVSVTNNGFSFIPSFTLGKPAAIFNFNVHGGKRFSFDPELRFSLQGRPWSFIFIWRYKLFQFKKFQLTAGAHLPALSFRTHTPVEQGLTEPQTTVNRFLTYELAPQWRISPKVQLGLFYLYGYGVEKTITRHTHFLSLRSTFPAVNLSKTIFLRINPQLFYLKTDAQDGFYVASGFNLGKKNWPISLGSMLNKAIRTEIAGKDFNWNISIIYALDRAYVLHRERA